MTNVWFCKLVVVSALLLFTSTSVVANDGANVRGLGMARTSVAVARGLDAAGVNPANLALPDGGILTFTILPLDASASSDLFTYDFYSRYFDKRSSFTDIAESDKQLILNSFPGEMSNSRAEATGRLFGALLHVDAKNTIAFTIDYGIVAGLDIPREYMRMLMYGNVRSTQFAFSGATAKAFWARTYGMSYGATLPTLPLLSWLTGGVGLKMVQGYGYYEVEQLAAALQTGYTESLSGTVLWRARFAGADKFSLAVNDLFQTPRGYGFGVDVGIAGGITEYLSFGASVTNLGGVRWTDDVERFAFEDTVVDVAPNVFNNLNSLERAFAKKKMNGGAFTSSLPSLMRIGFALDVDKMSAQKSLPGSLLVAAEYVQSIGESSPLREPPRVSLGVEYRVLQWLPLRTGFSYSDGATSHIAFGLGLNFRGFDVDFGTENILSFFNSRNASSASLGVGMRFRIPTDYVAR